MRLTGLPRWRTARSRAASCVLVPGLTLLPGLTLVLVLTLVLGACGFRPLYARVDGPAGAAGPAGIVAFVSEIEGRTGFAMQGELQKLFQTNRASAGAPRLEITLRESFVPLGIRLDRSATRVDVILSGQFILRGPDGLQLAQGPFTSTASYEAPGIVDADTLNARDGSYADLANQLDAKERAAREAGRLIFASAATQLERARRNAARSAPTLQPGSPAAVNPG